MIPGLPLAFVSPVILSALILLPAIWWLLRLTPPKPQTELFPPLAILARIIKREETPARSPWWLTLLRLAMAALVIIAMAGPVLNPREARLSGEGPLALIIDNGWASAAQWENRLDTARTLIDEAEAANRPVILVETAGGAGQDIRPVSASQARSLLESLPARPLKPSHQLAAGLSQALVREHNPGSLFYLSDGLARNETAAFASAFAAAQGQKTIVQAETKDLVALVDVRNDPDALIGTIERVASSLPVQVTVEALDSKGLPLARQPVSFAAGSSQAQFRLEQPVELRNQIARINVVENRSAGSVQLLDDRFRRRLVGLLSGEGADQAQPLLAPLYYISKALSPFSDIRNASSANIAEAVPQLLQQNVSAIVLADVGNLPEEAQNALGDWVQKGGTLIRFAGPRLAASGDDPLLPVKLRQGDRNLGGALSWETPKAVAAFESGSPFFGIVAPQEVSVKRQVLALQDGDLDRKTWAVLEDGTPLVTAEKRASGWIVLFHVGSDAEWSNLPISGTFVEMLRRVVSQSQSSGTANGDAPNASLPPLSILDGNGTLLPPDISVKPLLVGSRIVPVASTDNPPGLYGTEDGFVSLNLFKEGETLSPIDLSLFANGTAVAAYANDSAFNVAPWLLALAALLMTLDCLAVLWIAGVLRPRLSGATGSAAIIVAFLVVAPMPDAAAQTTDTGVDFSSALTTRLAYVETGDSEVDRISRAGLEGLTRYLASRTALEPGEPVGLDVSKDELSFYPVIYWPISMGAALPDNSTMARVDAFMKQGGTVLFDTRDQATGVLGGTSGSPEAQRLQLILSGLDIPPLQPVPPDHVLTKAFYLLSSFPGRYTGGELWVEQPASDNENAAGRPARAGDGVSAILITSNDLAAAWAIDASGEPMLPVVSQDFMQRELSYRTGVNIMMYAMTGNYKADQVHIPALLERLGQ